MSDTITPEPEEKDLYRIEFMQKNEVDVIYKAIQFRAADREEAHLSFDRYWMAAHKQRVGDIGAMRLVDVGLAVVITEYDMVPYEVLDSVGKR